MGMAHPGAGGQGAPEGREGKQQREMSRAGGQNWGVLKEGVSNASQAVGAGGLLLPSPHQPVLRVLLGSRGAGYL